MRKWIVTVALLAAALGVLPSAGRAEEAGPVGRFQISTTGTGGAVWQADTATGAIRLCIPPTKVANSPACSPAVPWSMTGNGPQHLTVEEMNKRLNQ